MLQGLVALDMAGGLQAVQARHAPIHEYNIVGSGSIVLFDGGQGFFSGRDRIHTAYHITKGFLQNFARGRIVIHDEHTQLGEFFGNDFP